MFIPTTRKEMQERGWDTLDVILVSGDAYIDSSYNGSAIIGHWLIENGFKVGMIAQPDIKSDADISRLGEPNLFWGVSAGTVDSMVANYSPMLKFRKDDDFTPGGVNNRRPDRACIAYTNLIKKYHKGKPVVLGGVEATLRRIVHYDYWSDLLRRSILFDAKADIITYGMGERANLLLAQSLRDGKDWKNIRGLCYISNEKPTGYLELPSYENCVKDNNEFIKAFKMFYLNNDPVTAKGLVQGHGNRFLVQNPPSQLLKSVDLDRIYELDYEGIPHPSYKGQGEIKAYATIRNSITTHRGCYGECNFCSIAVVQGRTVVSRSEESILREATKIANRKRFNGIINDVGGPTANMYGYECPNKETKGACRNKRCLYPKKCAQLPVNHERYVSLLKRITAIDGIKKVSVASGIRHDLVVADNQHGDEFLEELCRHHVSGQIKIAPEHVCDEVLRYMGKPGKEILLAFKEQFDSINRELGMDQFLTYYLIAAHPGCKDEHMAELSKFCREELKTNPEQIQIFTPTPSSVSTMMYHTHRNWENTNNIKVEHSMQMKQRQKQIALDPKEAKKCNIKTSKR